MEQHALRVMHVASGDLWAGAEAQISALASAFAATPRVQVAAAVLNEGELAKRLRNSGVHVLVIPESTYSSIHILRKLILFMRTWRPDVVHTHRTKENILGSIAARIAGVRCSIRTVHGASEFPHRRWPIHRQILRTVDRFVARHLQSVVVAVSHELASKLKSTLAGSRIVVIHNGIAPEDVVSAAQPAVRLPGPRRHVCFVGRLVPVKRVDVFLRMAHLLSRQFKDGYGFHIIGDGPLHDQLRKLCVDLSLDSDCLFHGFQSNVPQWLAAMDCVVFTSDHEGLPMVALEARSLGRPVVATAVGGLPELLSGAADCEIVRTQDAQQLANAVARCAVHTDAACRLPEQFRLSTTASQYVSLLQSLTTPH